MNKFLKKNLTSFLFPSHVVWRQVWTKAECYEFVSMGFWVPSFVPIDENRHSVGILSRVACSPARHAAPMLPVFPNWEFKVWNPHVFWWGMKWNRKNDKNCNEHSCESAGLRFLPWGALFSTGIPTVQWGSYIGSLASITSDEPGRE